MVEVVKIIERTAMPNGTEIHLEDWSMNNTLIFPNLFGLMIAAYPIAKNTEKYGWVRSGQTFCLTIPMNQYARYTNDYVKSDFEALKNGEKSLEDLAAHFWYGEEDMWYLGMDVEYKGW